MADKIEHDVQGRIKCPWCGSAWGDLWAYCWQEAGASMAVVTTCESCHEPIKIEAAYTCTQYRPNNENMNAAAAARSRKRWLADGAGY